jgi:hypothetical protein
MYQIYNPQLKYWYKAQSYVIWALFVSLGYKGIIRVDNTIWVVYPKIKPKFDQ